jgi:N6-L-threonylcarbamoyladenine synthase
LGYPGGPAIAKAADEYITKNSPPLSYFPRALSHDKTLDVSFSGLKTAVSRELNNTTKGTDELAAEIQEAIIDTLLNKVQLAIRTNDLKSVIISGGVTANSRFRKKFVESLSRSAPQLKAYMPDLLYCTDNAAMIGCRAFFHPIEVPLHSVSANPELHF